jgi:hypothetical protein
MPSNSAFTFSTTMPKELTPFRIRSENVAAKSFVAPLA